MPVLHERPIDFSYGYRMRCECGAAVDIDAQTYHREQTIAALVRCPACTQDVHFGPLVAMIRLEDDPALDNAQVNGFAWYHTSTWSDWPSPDHLARTEPGRRRAARLLHLDPEHAAQATAASAVHVGTYEAAIENMLRRMHNQSDATSRFYLYRVAVHVDPGRINFGFRDENDGDAAQLTVPELDAAGLDAVRYLNVHEACGSLSLALRPECVVAVQQLALPPTLLEPEALGTLRTDGHLRRLDERFRQVTADLAPFSSADVWEQMRLRVQASANDTGEMPRPLELEHEMYGIWRELDDLLQADLLTGISPVVVEALTSALDAARREDGSTPTEAAERFASFAPLLTRADDVVCNVSVRQARIRQT